MIAVDPGVSFGHPTIKGRRVKVAVLVDYIDSGESVSSVAREYRLSERAVRAAVAWQTSGSRRLA
jgi:uncharacterized protein (DUF433 family)